MEIKILISTPVGMADNVEKKLKPYVIGTVKKNMSLRMMTDKENAHIIWFVSGSVRDIFRIHRNVNLFDSIVKNTLNNPIVKRMVKPSQRQELEDLIKNHTKVDVVTPATQEEIKENNKPFWDKVKEWFKKS